MRAQAPLARVTARKEPRPDVDRCWGRPSLSGRPALLTVRLVSGRRVGGRAGVGGAASRLAALAVASPVMTCECRNDSADSVGHDEAPPLIYPGARQWPGLSAASKPVSAFVGLRLHYPRGRRHMPHFRPLRPGLSQLQPRPLPRPAGVSYDAQDPHARGGARGGTTFELRDRPPPADEDVVVSAPRPGRGYSPD